MDPNKKNSKTPDVGTAATDSSSTKAFSASQTFCETSFLLKNNGIHFLEFALGFLSLAKCHYQPSQDIKVNSLPFFALIALDSWADQDYTMSELADKLSITKQQLSHMIKILEERGLVERIHDSSNRRRVYIRICDSGRELMNQIKQDMLDSTLIGLRAYTQEELASMDECLCRLMKLMEKFNCEAEKKTQNMSV